MLRKYDVHTLNKTYVCSEYKKIILLFLVVETHETFTVLLMKIYIVPHLGYLTIENQ